MTMARGFGRKKIASFIVLIIVLSASAEAAEVAVPGTRMLVDWQKLINSQDIIITSPPKDSIEGLLIGNGEGISGVSL